MKKAKFHRLIVLPLLFMFLISTLFTPGLAKQFSQTSLKALESEELNPKLQNVLQQLILERNRGKSQAEQFATTRNIEMTEDRVTVIIEPLDNKVESINQIDLGNFGATIEASSESLLRATVPVENLDDLTNQVEGIEFIRLPHRPHINQATSITIETIDKIGAATYHNAGYKGQNTKIAVIDGGFNGLTEAIQSNDLPESVIASEEDFTGTGLETGSAHGTAVAEVIHDVAPEAELHLKKIGDDLDLENAKNSAVDEGVDIINHSLAWLNTSYYDGKGPISDLASDAHDSGVLWVNSAGNYALRHWQGNFSGLGDDWHDFEEEDECNELNSVESGDYIRIYMTWNDWPETDQDYDLYLSNNQGEAIATSTYPQDGNQEPTELISYSVPQEADTPYCVEVQNFDAPEAPEIDVFSINHGFQYPVEEKSVVDPAVDQKVMSVGAMAEFNWSSGPQEPFSSQGPTNDGRTKPNITGPDGVSTFSVGEFYGTSASAPHVSGAAALILSRENKSIDELQSSLESQVEDMGPTGKDNIYGSGKLDLSLQSEDCRNFSTTLPEGWNLFSPPGVPQETNPETALGDDINNPIIYRWEPALGTYSGGAASSTDLRLEAGAGYWLYVREDATEIDMQGCIPSSASLSLTEPGWQMVGSPFSVNLGNVKVNNVRIQGEIVEGSYTGPLDPYVFSYEEGENRYLIVESESWNELNLTQWEAYWVRTTESDVTLSFEGTDSTQTVDLGGLSKRDLLQKTKPNNLAMPPDPPPIPMGESDLNPMVSPTLIKGSNAVKFLVETDYEVEGLRAKVLNTAGREVWSAQKKDAVLSWKPEELPNGLYFYEVWARVNGEFKKAGIGKLLVLR